MDTPMLTFFTQEEMARPIFKNIGILGYSPNISEKQKPIRVLFTPEVDYEPSYLGSLEQILDDPVIALYLAPWGTKGLNDLWWDLNVEYVLFDKASNLFNHQLAHATFYDHLVCGRNYWQLLTVENWAHLDRNLIAQKKIAAELAQAKKERLQTKRLEKFYPCPESNLAQTTTPESKKTSEITYHAYNENDKALLFSNYLSGNFPTCNLLWSTAEKPPILTGQMKVDLVHTLWSNFNIFHMSPLHCDAYLHAISVNKIDILILDTEIVNSKLFKELNEKCPPHVSFITPVNRCAIDGASWLRIDRPALTVEPFLSYNHNVFL